MLESVSVVYSFLVLNSRPLYEFSTLCLLVQHLMDIWIVSSLGLL